MKRKLRFRHVRQAGDTIVEVLIAMALLSVAIAGAYTSANHSLNDVRTAQEHADAMTLAQSQVELLRGYLLANNCSPNGSCGLQPGQCMGASEAPSSNCYYASNNISSAQSSTACTQAVSSSGSYCYMVSINPVGHNGPQTTSVDCGSFCSFSVTPAAFSVTVTWDSLLGGQNKVSLNYASFTHG